MSDRKRILITGFQPFPGAPYNPTQVLVKRLLGLRRPALADVDLIGHIFPVTYRAVDRELPELLREHRPHAMLMFGLAARTPWVRIETRARNAITMLWPDAEHSVVRKGTIAGDACDMTFGPHTAKLLRAARGSGVDARSSRNAGSYLCNYLSWRAIEAVHADRGPRLAAFIHVPLVARNEGMRGKHSRHRITQRELADSGEAMLMEMARLTRMATLDFASFH